ncbi:MAG: phytanoyl-CoA dioxygenase family protein [Proteobacteria bacterium]|nr:phytanoyl-CoA dioxygenase family protein [Pseudomonadota bacterium]MDA0951769.1 phytanoyl-CoA dioxygenase family protein [Pseudomonadota bacterium]MDA1071211.1 phytanoyl-CoA dioxygenase family protein [Pseudomonadota bacterium]
MTPARALGADTCSDSAAQALVRDGLVVIEGLAPDLTARTAQEIAAALEHGTPESGTRRLGALFTRSATAQALALHPLVLALADALLLPSCARYQLNFTGATALDPGCTPQRVHRDVSLYPFLHPCPVTQIQAVWALDAFTADNGGLLVAPGSHRWPHERWPEPGEMVPVVMPTGSLLVYSSALLHGTGVNRSPDPAVSVGFQYSLGWLRQEENQYLAHPPEAARTYPEELRRLLGYDFGGPSLGFVDRDDPHRLFEEGIGAPARRSRPEIDAAQAALRPIRFGNGD